MSDETIFKPGDTVRLVGTTHPVGVVTGTHEDGRILVSARGNWNGKMEERPIRRELLALYTWGQEARP